MTAAVPVAKAKWHIVSQLCKINGSELMRENLTIPNILSACRILLIPVFVVLFVKGRLTDAVIVFAVSGVTDVLDGVIARKFKMESNLGKVLDPIADKLTQAAVLICISITAPVVIPLLLVLFAKEILMLIGAVKLYRIGSRPSPAKWFGKLSSVILYAVMTMLIINEIRNFMPLPVVSILVVGACLSVLFSVVKYYNIFKNIKSEDTADNIQRS